MTRKIACTTFRIFGSATTATGQQIAVDAIYRDEESYVNRLRQYEDHAKYRQRDLTLCQPDREVSYSCGINMSNPEDLRQAMRRRLLSLSVSQLVEVFELTNDRPTSDVSEVRGVIMDELEVRNSDAFMQWMSCDNAELAHNPSAFFK